MVHTRTVTSQKSTTVVREANQSMKTFFGENGIGDFSDTIIESLTIEKSTLIIFSTGSGFLAVKKNDCVKNKSYRDESNVC